ncbi:MAG: hypothetical protein HY094_04840 [Candidatus Melainabacteria bacterium]|nr:hypothetical protein [Candidatus Melainabacteria bacterium]
MKKRKKSKKLITVKSLSEVPDFHSEDAERRYWETHDISKKLWDRLYDPKIEKEANSMIKRLKMTDRRK